MTRRNDKNETMRLARTQQQLRFKNEPKSKLVFVFNDFFSAFLFCSAFFVRKQFKQITQHSCMIILINWVIHNRETLRECVCDEQVNFLIVQFVHRVFPPHSELIFIFFNTYRVYNCMQLGGVNSTNLVNFVSNIANGSRRVYVWVYVNQCVCMCGFVRVSILLFI